MMFSFHIRPCKFRAEKRKEVDYILEGRRYFPQAHGVYVSMHQFGHAVHLLPYQFTPKCLASFTLILTTYPSFGGTQSKLSSSRLVPVSRPSNFTALSNFYSSFHIRPCKFRAEKEEALFRPLLISYPSL